MNHHSPLARIKSGDRFLMVGLDTRARANVLSVDSMTNTGQVNCTVTPPNAARDSWLTTIAASDLAAASTLGWYIPVEPSRSTRGLDGRASTGTFVIRSADRLIGPFNGRQPAETLASEMRRAGLDARLTQLSSPDEVRDHIRIPMRRRPHPPAP